MLHSTQMCGWFPVLIISMTAWGCESGLRPYRMPSGEPSPHVFGEWSGTIGRITVYDKNGNEYAAMVLNDMKGPFIPGVEDGADVTPEIVAGRALPLLVTARSEIINALLLPEGKRVIIDGVRIGAGEPVRAPVIGSPSVRLSRFPPPKQFSEVVIKVRKILSVESDGTKRVIWMYTEPFTDLQEDPSRRRRASAVALSAWRYAPVSWPSMVK